MSEDTGKINSKQKEYLTITLENTEKIIKIVGSLLDASRIEEQKYELNPEYTDLVKITQGIIRDITQWAKAQNCEIIFKPEKDCPMAYVDPLKINYVIENLITNAVKYKGTEKGLVVVVLEEKNNKILFSCTDNGMGVSEEDWDKIFLKFYRSEKALAIDPTSTGLGLYISKAIVELSDGKIWFEKNEKQGTTFYFELPLALIQ